MSNSFSRDASKKILDYIFGKSSLWTQQTSLTIKASTTTIAEDGSNLTEPSGNNYSAATITNGATQFPAASSADPPVKSTASGSNGDITFPQASGSWGTILDIGIFDGTQLVAIGTLTTPKAIGSGDTLKIPGASLTISLN